MTDILLELISAAIMGIILIYLWRAGRKENISQQQGWIYILAGFSLIFLGMLVDVTDNFPILNKYVVIGDTEYEAFLEKVVGGLFGFVFLAVGLWKWIPTVVELRVAKRQLKEHRNELETKVSERTAELLEITAQLKEEIEERKKREEQLRQAAIVYEVITEGIVITDADVNIIAINKAVTEITGFSEAECLGKKPSLWKSDCHDQSFYQTIWDSIEQMGKWRGEIWSRNKSGEDFPCWQTITAVSDNSENILHYISVISDITDIKESHAQIEHAAHHDPLTTLPNRLLFSDRLEHALERAHRKKNGVGVMFLDLDNFKPINDSLGHRAGDKVLQLVAKRLIDQVRDLDTVSRIAGDEFALILEEITDSQAIAEVARKIVSAIEAPLQVDGQELHVTVSIGISLYPDDGKDVTMLLKNADAAMYRAKENGKNQYCFYTLDLTEIAQERLQLGVDMKVALKRNEFIVYYQPQYDTATGQLTGAEALVRWQHPEKGMISPVKFIPIAENNGLIIPLGEWVLREACAQTKTWQEAGHPIERIGVNIAGQQIQRNGFVQTVHRVLEETGLAPQCLELEITESFIMKQAEDAITTLKKLKGLGVHMSIDDFGTGYSSLSYLKRLPIDKLKIDRLFVKDIPQSSDDKAIAKAIIALAKSLQLKVIAEGVETEEQQLFLKSEGCNEVQGFLYSAPVPAKKFIEILATFKMSYLQQESYFKTGGIKAR